MDKLFINIDDIKRFRPIGKEIPPERVNPFIFEAQHNDLQPVLTPVLYKDFADKFDNTGDPMYTAYQELLTGKNYTPSGKQGDIIYEGIIPMLVYFSLARFYENNAINITRFGIVQKSNAESEAVSQQALTAQIETLRANGIAYQNKVVQFIQDNITSYPLYEGRSETVNRTGIKFFDV